MICFSNAKINIGLHVTGRRADGYHNIETLFYPVGLSDIIEVLPAGPEGQDTFFNTGSIIDVDPDDNLCLRALRELQACIVTGRVGIHLHKIIPQGAGLGGGSSNAAFVIRAVNELFKSGMQENELASVASRIGSDCSFFIYNSPMFAEGRGDILEHAGIDLSGYRILIVFPGFRINTAWAYGKISVRQGRRPLREVIGPDPSKWRGSVVNDFEKPVFQAHPVIRDIKRRLDDAGALYASMTGSGSAVYGIFAGNSDTGKLKEMFTGMFVWSGIIG